MQLDLSGPMQRAMFVLLLSASAALGQGLDGWITEALDPRTSPSTRHELLSKIVTANGLDKLAEKGLDPDGDPEVVHAVVDTLFNQGNPDDYLERVVGLLSSEKQKEKVLGRIQRVGEYPRKARALVAGLKNIAQGKTPDASQNAKLREAGILALGSIQRRDALEAIIEVGLNDEQVRDTCLGIVKTELYFDNLRMAQEFLAGLEPHRTYNDLVKERGRAVKAENIVLLAKLAEYLRVAPANKIFTELGNGHPQLRHIAAERLEELAEKGEFAPLSAEDFAKQAFQVFSVSLAAKRRDPRTLASLCGALEALARDKAPLLKVVKSKEDFLNALQPLSGGSDKVVGAAALGLLDAFGPEAQRVLVDFVRDFGDAGVRRDAIQRLQRIALRNDESQIYIGGKLTDILSKGQRLEEVQGQILFALARSFRKLPAEAQGVIDGLLRPADPKATPELTDRESGYCVEILLNIGTAEALETLRWTSATHPQPAVRRVAIEEGLLRWAARDPKGAGEILAYVKSLALDAQRPAEERRAVVEALGNRGTRDAVATLNELGAVDELKDLVGPAKFKLANRLATPAEGAALASEDLAAAVALLEELAGGEANAVGALARAIVKAGDDAKIPVGVARYRVATSHEREHGKEAKPDDLLRLWQAAADKATVDGVPEAIEERICLRLKEVLLDGQPDKQRYVRAVACAERLAALVGKKDSRRAAGFLLDAAEYALLAQERDKAGELLVAAEKDGPLEGAQATRLQKLREKLKPSEDGTD